MTILPFRLSMEIFVPSNAVKERKGNVSRWGIVFLPFWTSFWVGFVDEGAVEDVVGGATVEFLRGVLELLLHPSIVPSRSAHRASSVVDIEIFGAVFMFAKSNR